MMLDLALKAQLPMVGVLSDDPVHQVEILKQVVGHEFVYSATANLKPQLGRIYWTEEHKLVTVELYRALEGAESTMVVFNPPESPLVFDAGVLAAPETMIQQELEPYDPLQRPALTQALKGLSVKAVKEVLALTAARAHAVTVVEIRKTRATLSGGVQGLTPVETAMDFYEMPAEIKSWLEVDGPYFKNPPHPRLQPRGLLLTGVPGVGKSLAPKAIARALDVPLYRLDLAMVMNRWLGTAERRVQHSLQMVEKESPAILLIDEGEKVLGKHADNETVQRILSQLLWWMAEHRSKVLTVITTNDFKQLPPELYRPGRINKVIELKPFAYAHEASAFAEKVFEEILQKPPAMEQRAIMCSRLLEFPSGSITPADVWETVGDAIKNHQWG